MTDQTDLESTNERLLETQLLQMLRGTWIAQSIHVAAKLGIADLLHKEPRHVDDLAQATGAHAAALYRLLRMLSSLGIFAETDDKRFGMTPLAARLRSDVPGSLRALAIIYGEAIFWQSWGNALHAVKTGETAFEHTFDRSIYAYLAETPAIAELFAQAMSGLVTQVAIAVAEAYDFSPCRRIVDVGGGNGVLVAAALNRYPHLTAILFDQQSVIENAQRRAEMAALADRCSLVAGDFFQAVPESGDVYILSTILCNWEDTRAATILRNCRRAMPNASKLLIIEIVIPSGNTPSPGKLLDMQMMMITGGRDRTETEYQALLAASGFALTQVIPTSSERSIIEAIPVNFTL